MAFPETYSANMFAFDMTLNALFSIDIILNFFTAFYDDRFNLVDNPKVKINQSSIRVYIDFSKFRLLHGTIQEHGSSLISYLLSHLISSMNMAV